MRLTETMLAEDGALRRSFAANAEKRGLALSARALRRAAGLTQRQLAARSRLSQSHVSKIESATGPMPSLATLRRYAAACGAQVTIGFEPAEETDARSAPASGPALAAAT